MSDNNDTHEVRELTFRLKQAHKTMGRQGRKIHDLRADLALVREENSKIDRGELRSLQRQVDALSEDLDQARKQNKKLREERATAGGVS